MYASAVATFAPPTPSATVSACAPVDGAWHNSDVTIACSASDLGSGLATAADASFNLTTNVAIGTTTASAATNSRQVCDSAGNCTTAGPITGNKVDKVAPTIACSEANGAWQSSDVTIACSAGDLGSGLANAADASFNLTTNVPIGTETGNAATNNHQVCDSVGNCATVGPITGLAIDKKGPTITIASPMAGATYVLKANVGASYACSDGGSVLASCRGPVANGSPINTSMGTKTFVVTAADGLGNSSRLSVTYTVVSRKKTTGGGE